MGLDNIGSLRSYLDEVDPTTSVQNGGKVTDAVITILDGVKRLKGTLPDYQAKMILDDLERVNRDIKAENFTVDEQREHIPEQLHEAVKNIRALITAQKSLAESAFVEQPEAPMDTAERDTSQKREISPEREVSPERKTPDPFSPIQKRLARIGEVCMFLEEMDKMRIDELTHIADEVLSLKDQIDSINEKTKGSMIRNFELILSMEGDFPDLKAKLTDLLFILKYPDLHELSLKENLEDLDDTTREVNIGLIQDLLEEQQVTALKEKLVDLQLGLEMLKAKGFHKFDRPQAERALLESKFELPYLLRPRGSTSAKGRKEYVISFRVGKKIKHNILNNKIGKDKRTKSPWDEITQIKNLDDAIEFFTKRGVPLE